jgi:hypothetical protein
MQIPPLLGNLDQDKFFIYAAADTVYFDLHAKPLINSIIANTPEIGVHIHIYNPRPDQIEFCRSRAGVTCSYENPSEVDFQSATDYWLARTQFLLRIFVIPANSCITYKQSFRTWIYK